MGQKGTSGELELEDNHSSPHWSVREEKHEGKNGNQEGHGGQHDFPKQLEIVERKIPKHHPLSLC